jgi:hypothetical protein
MSYEINEFFFFELMIYNFEEKNGGAIKVVENNGGFEITETMSCGFVALLCSLLSSVHFVPSILCNDFDDPVSLQSVQPRSNNDFLVHM